MPITALATIRRRRVGLVLLAALLLAPALTRAAAPPAAAVSEAEQIFKSRCVLCHGVAGQGDGAASVALNPKPRKFSDPAWQTSVTDAHIDKIILDGGVAVGKSPMMPANPDLRGKPDVIQALRDLVRSFGATP